MKNKKLFIFGIVVATIALISSGMFVFPASVKAAATTWNVSVGSSGLCTGVDPNCANIQDAINAASAGDTISVAAGTYTEDLVVDKSDITLKSVSGTATIQLVDGVGIDVQVGGFTLGGALGKGFIILPGATTTFLIQLANAPVDVTISYNTMNTIGAASMGINVGIAGASGLTVIYNNFSAADVNDGAIWGPLLVDVNISDNTFTGPSALAAGGYAIQFSGVTGTSTIHGNHITNTANGIRISHGEGVSGLTIDGNIITGAVNAIRFEEYKASGGADGDMTTVIITNNVLSSNTTDLRIGDGAHIKAAQFAITQNLFGSTTGTGLNNQHATEVVDAVSNWWGNATGPYNLTTNPAGTGSDVSDNVVYNPWNNTSSTTTQTYHVFAAEPTYTTIQGAITAASAGDTVLVTADTYTEDLTVNKADIKLESISGAATTIIQLVTGAGIDLQAGATGFTLGGATGKGFTILPGAATTRLIQLENAPADVTISYNAMNTTGNATMGINVGAAGATGLTVSNNIFSAADVGDGAIWGPLLVDVNISDNTFVGPGALAANGYAIQFSGVTGTSVIHGNDISDTSQGIVIAHGEGVSGLTIDGNTIAGAVNGLRFAQYKASGGADGDMTTVTVSNNTLSGNTIDLRIGDGANIIAGLFTINRNSFGGTTGLDNQHATGAVTATHNWWGNTTGPYNATSNSAGTGSIVSDNVTYNPWYVDAAMTSLHIVHYNGGDIGGGGGGGGYYPTPTPTATPVPTATPSPTTTPIIGPVTIPTLPANPTNADYQNLLNALLQQLAYLQGLAVVQQGGTTPTPAASTGYKFGVGLAFGNSGEGVRQLQIFLKAQGAEIYPEGLVTGQFGSLTQKAVQRFQEKYGIAKAGEAGYGYVGPATRAKINALQGL